MLMKIIINEAYHERQAQYSFLTTDMAASRMSMKSEAFIEWPIPYLNEFLCVSINLLS